MRKHYSVPLPGGRTLELGGRTLVMGVLNVTPDSFSDGGRFSGIDAAVRRAVEMAAAGADIIDIGGESTRPGAEAVPADEEVRRVIPVIRAVAEALPAAVISADTNKAAVAEAAVAAGAAIVNDIRGLSGDPAVAGVAARTGAALVLMHCPVAPKVMRSHTDYADLLGEVTAFLRRAVESAVAAGVRREAVIVDPGFGFAKTAEQSGELLDRLDELAAALDRPVLSGPSRKSFLGRALGRPDDPPASRVWADAAAVAWSVARGAHIVRVHDVEAMAQVARACDWFAARGGRETREARPEA
jgi:dihydropteroate synthase